MPQRDIIPLVADMVKESEDYSNTLSADRIKANEYYDGKMLDTPSDNGRSAFVVRDVRSVVQDVLPALTRVFLASDRMVEFQPAGQQDEEIAEQATDYINHVVFPESDGPTALEDSIHDALKTRNGFLKWWYDEKTSIKVSRHTGQPEASFAEMVAEEGVEVLEHTERQETVGGVVEAVHDYKIRRRIVERRACVKCIPPEEFLIHPDAMDEDTASCIGHKMRLRRSDLVAMGYDRKVIDAIPENGSDGRLAEAEEITRRENLEGRRNERAKELQEIDYYEMYVRIDKDGDGIAELRRMCFGGKITEETLLDDEEADEVPFAIIKTKSKPHQWEGVAVADDIMDIQRVRTVLMRQTLDNLYWQNNQQVAVRQDLLTPESMSAVTNPQFGQGIFLKPGASASEAIQPILVPFIAEKSFGMLEWLEKEKKERTGITDASAGMPPDALQNVTAKASAMMEQAGIGQAEMMARTLANGFRRMFRGLLRLIVKHQDKPRTVRLRDEWVQYDPRQWNAEMDCTVNTGLGAGTRERDVAVLMNVLTAQKEILAAYGPKNKFVTPEHLSNALYRLTEASGLRTPQLYFGKPSKEEVQAMMEAPDAPDPEVVKVQAQLQAQKEMKQMDMQASAYKERVQSEAAVQEAAMRADIEAQDKERDRQLKKYEVDQRNQIEWAKLGIQQETQTKQLEHSNTLERERMDREDNRHFAPMGLEKDDKGKPVNKSGERLEMMLGAMLEKLEASNRPRRVRTPDGEEFVMEPFDPMAVN